MLVTFIVVSRYTDSWTSSLPTRSTLFLNNIYISLKLSSTRFEQVTVHHQVCTSSLQYFTIHLKSSLAAEMIRTMLLCFEVCPCLHHHAKQRKWTPFHLALQANLSCICKSSYQCSSTSGRHNTGGMQKVFWWNAKSLGNCGFIYISALRMLMTPLKLFLAYLHKKNNFQVFVKLTL